MSFPYPPKEVFAVNLSEGILREGGGCEYVLHNRGFMCHSFLGFLLPSYGQRNEGSQADPLSTDQARTTTESVRMAQYQ